MELVDFLRARLDEDEAQARAAMTFQAAEWHVEMSGIVTTSSDTDVYTDDRELAEHIARHDPARVLAEVEAKRALLRGAVEWEGGTLEYYILAPLARVYRDHPDFDPAWLED